MKSSVVMQIGQAGFLLSVLGRTEGALSLLQGALQEGDYSALLTKQESEQWQECLDPVLKVLRHMIVTTGNRLQVMHRCYQPAIDKVYAEPEELQQLQVDDEDSIDTPLVEGNQAGEQHNIGDDDVML